MVNSYGWSIATQVSLDLLLAMSSSTTVDGDLGQLLICCLGQQRASVNRWECRDLSLSPNKMHPKIEGEPSWWTQIFFQDFFSLDPKLSYCTPEN